ncbi:ABC transporter permease [Clostridium thermosuccinogenes]|uniref:ABC transporter permease n=1 Tax=Clostridium thermosuccinogenes TaxID=84032 RepID=A0A2K2FCL7_9CLOT|nr:carbohydrate ABC transporter permease [Pseudoclostridium thermosuccinogenes]AUS95531.1 ABC transporter permease [Pseudoclostridium thermosuccinogenes]PNT90393.1 ABC transporter permease [Pseudoclostridium thermosuccinogenes]PNT96515.1 ABC transporter permease [Pseudoclostridium thermosuccinogenes]PNT98258.1 ABC transporter permease [Pseudoclostridium thermosuccinogenes]
MFRNRSLKNELSFPQKIINWIFLAFIFIIMVIPMLNVLVISTSTALDASQAGLKLWWTKFSIEGYEYVFRVTKLGRPFLNSLFVSFTSTIIQVIISSLAGYILVQRELPFRKAITSFILLTMMIPGDLTLISIYQVNKQLHLLNSYTGLIINGLVSGFCILLMRNYFLSVPESLAESARLDGASELRIFSVIYLPLSIPGLATIFFLEFVGKWNSMMIPATLITDQSLFTLPLMLKSMIINNASVSGAPPAPENAVMAAIVIATVPLILIYVFAQRFLLSGMTLGASKE